MGLEGLNLEAPLHKREEVALEVEDHGFLGSNVKGQTLISEEMGHQHDDFMRREPCCRYSVPCLEDAHSLSHMNLIIPLLAFEDSDHPSCERRAVA